MSDEGKSRESSLFTTSLTSITTLPVGSGEYDSSNNITASTESLKRTS